MDNILLDACCLINLLSTGRIAEMLLALPCVFHVCDAVVQESLFIEIIEESQTRHRAPVDLNPHFDSGVFRRAQPETADEIAAFVRYATVLDDGEAMSFALAKCRSWAVATDDRKARRLAIAEGITTTSTIELLKEWSEKTGALDKVVRDAVQFVATLGRYRPSRNAPEANWWRAKGGPINS